MLAGLRFGVNPANVRDMNTDAIAAQLTEINARMDAIEGTPPEYVELVKLATKLRGQLAR